jgi:putative oxidoreductase
LLFLEHATQKLFAFPVPAPPNRFSPPALETFEGWLELVGSIMLLIGFRSRIVAFILSGEMAVAFFLVHAPRSIYPIATFGDMVILYCFIFLLFVFSGGGAWTVDSHTGWDTARPGKDASR